MQGYRQFCRFFLRSRECTRVLEIKYEVDPEFDALLLLDLITEGSRQYKKPGSLGKEREVGVVPISERRKYGENTNRQFTEVTLDEEEERKFHIKIEPVETMQFHEEVMEQEVQAQEICIVSYCVFELIPLELSMNKK